MKLWIDNTGLQSASQCLLGRAAVGYDHDIRGFLQLATQIIYGTSIELNGFEGKLVADRTAGDIALLRSLEIGEDILAVSAIGEAEYALACETAAQSVARNLADTFYPDEFRLVGGEPPELPKGVLQRQVKAIELAFEPEDSTTISKVLASALDDKAVGAVKYMIAADSNLRASIRELVDGYPKWTESHSFQLNIFLRAHLNHALADGARSRYSPAIARAELINRRSEFILSKLGQEVDTIVDELRGKPLGVPTVWAALLERSKGYPKPLLSEALELRVAATPLRKALSKLKVDSSEESTSSRHDLICEIKELGHQIRRDLQLETSTGFWDAFEVQFILGIPAPSVSGKKLLTWAKQQWQSRKTAVLTDLAKAVAYSDFHPKYYERLQKESTTALR